MNLIIASINVNLDKIKDIDFKSLTIEYSKNKRNGVLEVHKDTLEINRIVRKRDGSKNKVIIKVPVIRYIFDGKSYVIQERDSIYALGLEITDDVESITAEYMQDLLNKVFKVVFLSVNRQNDEFRSRLPIDRTSSIRQTGAEALEQRIGSLLDRMGNNRVRLASLVASINKKGEKELLTTLLFD